jgi:hypothetical protein
VNEGTYWGRLKKGVTSESGANKTPTMCITFDVTHILGTSGEWEPAGSPAERTVFLYMTDASWPYTEEKLTALGFNGSFDDPKFSKEESELRCTIKTYQGKSKEKWDIGGGGSFEAKPASKDVTRQLNAKWKAKTKAPSTTPKPPGKPAAPKQPVGAGAPTSASHELRDEDIPFDEAG